MKMVSFLTVFLFLVIISLFHKTEGQVTPAIKPTIRVGIAAAQSVQPESIGWSYCGGAVVMALNKLQEKGLVSNFNFEFHVDYTECDRANTVRVGLDFMTKLNVDVIIGPPCIEALKVMGTLASIYSKPVVGWGFVSSSEISDVTRFPNVATVLANSQTLGYAVSQLLETFKWDKVALFYIANELNYCKSVVDDVESALNDPSTYQVQIVVKEELDPAKDEVYNTTMENVKTRARIIFICAQTALEKKFYLAKVAALNMTTNEYVHVLLSMRSIGFGAQITVSKTKFTMSGLAPVWEASATGIDDGSEALAKVGASKMLVLDLSSDIKDVQYMQYMLKNSLAAVRGPPFYCNTTSCLTANITGIGAYARHLYDAFYLYAVALNSLNTTSSSIYQNLSNILPKFQTIFDGMTGQVSLNQNLSRQPYYQLYGLDASYDQISLMNLSFIDGITKVSLSYTDESKTVWHFWNGTRPLATPICGFLGKTCPTTFVQQYGVLIFVAIIVAILTFITFLIFLICVIRNKREEQKRINSEWQIPFIKLKIPEKKSHGSNSKRSLQSAPSTTTGESHFSINSEFHENYSVQFLDKDMVLTTKHQSMTLRKNEMERFVKLRKLEHENLNKFIGLSIDGPQFLAVWKMCARGSLQDIISRGNFSMDSFFMYCIIRDVAEGLQYLHHSFLRVHGNLRSATCLVNDSWQVKLADFGLDILFEEDSPPKKRMLWVSPEVLRDSTPPSKMEPTTDVYSFAIIASEILTKKEAFDLNERKESTDEIIYLVKKGGQFPMRPDLVVDGIEVNTALLQLVKDCWSERPEDRPATDEICKILRDMMPKTKTNLMDHVFNMLEEYTSTLELEVEERTKELTVEKKKADILLGRMLPKQVAERLKLGQTVEPEGFDSVSVFFSDVVKFTILATKCSPFQVVNLLNDLYSNFDSIIEKHGVYKVESIGDGYLCVSGLPIRIGTAHIKQIVDMSLAFMNYVKTFKIPHLPRERVELRIGINSGPCVAGVVGLSMPRYCLFGDTVNTASRMESNGKSSYIHMSTAAHDLLTSHYPRQYETHSRGEVIIKGKGVMETFWVLDRIDGQPSTTSNQRFSTPPTSNTEENYSAPRKDSIPPPADTPESLARSISPITEYVKLKDDEALYRKYRKDTLKVV